MSWLPLSEAAPETSVTVTGNPDDAVAARVQLLPAGRNPPGEENVIVCGRRETVRTAGALDAVPAPLLTTRS